MSAVMHVQALGAVIQQNTLLLQCRETQGNTLQPKNQAYA